MNENNLISLPSFSIVGKKIDEIQINTTATIKRETLLKVYNGYRLNKKQIHGSSLRGGLRHKVDAAKKGSGRARVQRMHSGKASESPNVVSGRRSHPPKTDKNLKKKLNKKEIFKSMQGCILSLLNLKEFKKKELLLVQQTPIILQDNFLDLTSRSEIENTFTKFGFMDIISAANKKIRAGKGKMRNRRYKKNKFISFVFPKKIGEDYQLKKMIRNYPGIVCLEEEKLCILDFMKSGLGGRLFVFFHSSFKRILKKYGLDK